MSDIFDIHEMSEEDIKHEYITTALEAKWDAKKISMETEIWKAVKKRNQNLHISASPLNNFTDGKVKIKGNIPSRDKGKRCDYILWYNKGTPLAIVEAKDNNHSSSYGLQQAISYGVLLDVPFVYTSNGSTFFEHDFTTGLEKEIPLSDFPTAEELMNRWRGVDAEKIMEVENRMTYAIDGENKCYDVPLCFEEKLLNTPFYSGADCYPPRYYQRNAVNRTLEAIAKHQARILIAMATGTGKTYTAFQIVWRLIESGTKKKVLYLADRNNLVDQSIQQDFKPLEKVIHKINFQKEDKSKISAYQVYFALYQQLDSSKHKDESEEETDEEISLEVSKYKEYFTPDFFDLIIVDECHRGSAKADSRWRKILEYFNGATQIGMTATPKETKYVSNIDYFGEPVYSYSLKQGIEDGFLAPFKVINVHTNIDDGWRPKKGQKDIHGNEIEDREYNLSDYDYNIIIQDRIDEVAAEITKYLKETDRMSKTIVFCPTEDAADRMRVALNNLNTDMVLKDNQGNVKEQYVVRITGRDKYGKDKLDYFISVSQPYPVIATTSKLLSTGSDCKMVKLIVIDELINSMTEFKQIIGRGTRLRYSEGKTHFTIMDFRRVSRLFADPEWDGEIEQDEEFGSTMLTEQRMSDKENSVTERSRSDSDDEDGQKTEKRTIQIIGKGQIKVGVLQRLVSIYDTDGKILRQVSIEDYTKESILGTYQTLENFIQTWNGEQKKEIIRNMLKEKGIDLELIKKDQNMTDVDDFDFICHIAFNQKPLTRRERAENVKKRDIFGKYGDAAREVINALLDKYAELGIYDIESTEILKQNPFTKYGKPARIAALFGGSDKYRQALREIESELYRVA
ncbi:EcoAI/FtnUII family type I restriction enzme subunit R [Treponema sp.]|uniref:EcoAI/FtnUII family type I restriction enzme subunit R n=1 Tax=Treponema sp. TaxID=166 RepID=UPI0025F33766|nr:DEAD/DEAH box helicase family protein [Treponema sp.]MBR4321938.1 DEAD/DEAH box helicase family protein [Treponema sp.]